MANKPKTVRDILEELEQEAGKRLLGITNALSQIKELVPTVGEIYKDLRENGLPEEQDRIIYKCDGSRLLTKGSYVEYLAKSIHKAIIEKMFKKETDNATSINNKS